MKVATLVSLLSALPAAMACLGYTGGVPKATGTKSLSAPRTLKKNEVFDAGWVRYDRGVKCSGQAEGGMQFHPSSYSTVSHAHSLFQVPPMLCSSSRTERPSAMS